MHLNKAEDIETVLVLSLIQGIPIVVKVAGIHNKTFSSSFVEICSDTFGKPSLLIDRLKPEVGNQIISYSQSINITFSVAADAGQGEQTYTFNAQFISEDRFEERPVLRMSFPEQRRYNRVEPREGEVIEVTVHGASGAVAAEPLVNISEGGLAFYSGLAADDLPQGGCIPVSFRLPDGTAVESRVIIRWLSTIARGENLAAGERFFCGVEFDTIDDDMRAHVVAYVKDREKEELQEMVDDESLWTEF